MLIANDSRLTASPVAYREEVVNDIAIDLWRRLDNCAHFFEEKRRHPNLFLQLADQCVDQRLAALDVTARKAPAIRIGFPFRAAAGEKDRSAPDQNGVHD